MGKVRRQPRTSGVAGALFTVVQQRVLGLLFGQPGRRFQSSELIRLARSGSGAVQRQLRRLTDSGLVLVSRAGSQKYYQADARSPVFPELHGLVVKTVGLVEPLREALAPLAAKIDLAFVYGSVAKGTETTGSDVDLLIVSDALSYPDLYAAIESAEKDLARAVNPTLMKRKEWQRARSGPDSFARRIAGQPRLAVLGADDGDA